MTGMGFVPRFFWQAVRCTANGARIAGLRQHPVVGFYARLCIGCGACAAVCPKGIGIDLNAEREKCVSCGACVAACPKGARKALVPLADADEIIAEAAKHRLSHRNSGGGITFFRRRSNGAA